MKKFLLLASLVLALDSIAQVELKLIFRGGVTDTNNQSLSDVGFYLIQDDITMAYAQSDLNGKFLLSGSIYKKTSVVLQCSKPGYLHRNLYFDLADLVIPKKVLSLTIMLAENLNVKLYPINPNLPFTIGKKEFAEKFTWDNQTLECKSDQAYSQKYNDSLRQRVRVEEGRLSMQQFQAKSKEFEQVQNFKLAINYIDSAISIQSKYKLADTSMSKKKQILIKNLTSQLETQRKQDAMDSIFQKGDSLLALLKWQEAEKVYKAISNYDPKSQKLSKKLASIAVLKKEEEDRKKELAMWAKNRLECTKLANGKKYSEAIVAINKSNSLTRIPESLKKSIPITVDSLNILNKEQNLDKEVKSAMDAAKKIKSDNQPMKSALEKITALIGNYQEQKKQSTSFADLDKIITAYVDNEIKRAYDLQSKQDYDKAIQVYDQTREIIAFMHDASTKQSKQSDIKQKVDAAIKAKEVDILAYKNAITKANSLLDSMTFDAKYGVNYQSKMALGIFKTLLANNPLKLKAKNTEVIALNNRFNKIKPYFESNAKLLPVMADKDSIKALKAANELLFKAKAAEVGTLEINFLQAKIDSITLKLKAPKVTSNSSNSVRGIVLSPPSGAKLFTGLLSTTVIIPANDLNDQRVRNAWDRLKLTVESSSFEENKVNEQNRYGQWEYLDTKKSNFLILDQEEEKRAKDRELSNNLLLEKTQLQIDKRNEENVLLNQSSTDKIDKIRNQYDSLTAHNNDGHNQIHELTSLFMDSMTVLNTKNNIENQKENLLLDSLQRTSLAQNELLIIKEEQKALEQLRLSELAQEKQRNYVESTSFAPNYLKDEKGICYPWNSFTELVYIFEDDYGFVTGKIVRRIVVNMEGYGVVYEQNINQNGIASFTLNGIPIIETVWQQDSSGTSVIKPGGSKTPPICP